MNTQTRLKLTEFPAEIFTISHEILTLKQKIITLSKNLEAIDNDIDAAVGTNENLKNDAQRRLHRNKLRQDHTVRLILEKDLFDLCSDRDQKELRLTLLNQEFSVAKILARQEYSQILERSSI